jgi:hypothetical protein
MTGLSKLFLLVMILPCMATAADYRPEQKRLSSRVCVERFEDNGVLNIRAANVVIVDQHLLVISGDRQLAPTSNPVTTPSTYGPVTRMMQTQPILRLGDLMSFRLKLLHVALQSLLSAEAAMDAVTASGLSSLLARNVSKHVPNMRLETDLRTRSQNSRALAAQPSC